MKYIFKNVFEKAFLYSENNVVTEVNNNFINLTGYSNKELIGKSLTEINNMLRIDAQVNLENIENEYSCYMFTKELEPKEVIISCKGLNGQNEKAYLIKETENSIVKEKFDFIKQLYTDSKTGISIISVPDLILLNVNDNYLNYFDKPNNTVDKYIGKKHKEIINEYGVTKAEEIWNYVITTGKPYYFEEFEHQCYNRGIIYWNVSVVPMFIEGKLKYIINKILDVTEKVINKKLLQERIEVIKEQKEQLEAVIENVSDYVFISDKEGKIINVNSKVKNNFDSNILSDLEEIYKSNKYFDMLGNEIAKEKMPKIRALNGEKIKNEIMLIKSGNEERIIEYNATPICDINGKITMGAVFYNNITDSYNNKKIIKEQKEELEAILENMYDSLVIFDKDGNIKKVNKAAKAYDFYCAEAEKMNDYAKHFEIVDIDGNIKSEENSIITRILKGEKISRYQCAIKINNSINYVELNGNPIYDEKGDFIAGILVVRNVTERLKNEETSLLKAQYDLISSIIENVDVGVVRYSYPEYKIIYINNKTYIDLKQINPKIGSMSSVIGENYFDTFLNNKKNDRIKVIQNLSEKKGGQYFINRKVSLSGEEKFSKVIYKPLFGLNNQIYEIIVVKIDITEEVKAKIKMEETLKIQDEMFSNISHELKTPLNVIFSTNQLMEFYLKNGLLEANDKKISKGINIIKQNCYRFSKIINNIIDISKIESGFLKLNLSNQNIVNITEDIVQSVSDYIKLKGLNIMFDTNIEEKIIACDPDKIERIILNIISNAVKFTNMNGSIFVNILDKSDIVEISIKDTGIGMDQMHLDNIFKRFHQIDKSLSRNAEGSGIGLSLVKSIVELHGGKISVESKPNEGSIFKIELPTRTIEKSKVIEESMFFNNKIERINIEFSDIYSI